MFQDLDNKDRQVSHHTLIAPKDVPKTPEGFFDRIAYGFWMMFNEPFEVFKPLYLGPEDPSVTSNYQIELKMKSGDTYLYFTPIHQKSGLEPMLVGIDKGSGVPAWIRVGNSVWGPDKIYRFQKYMPISSSTVTVSSQR